MSSRRSFRFGAVTTVDGPATAWADAARRLEAGGYATILVPDTLSTTAPFQALAAAAAATSTLRLGTWVLSAPLRRPAEVVREVRTLQVLAEGRVELGIGAGRPGGEQDAAALGVPWGSPGERVRQVEETLEAVIEGMEQAPPVVVAGSGERMLRLASRYAATLTLPVAPTADLSQVTGLAERARAARPDLELALQVTGVGDEVPAFVRERMGLTGADLRARGAAAMLSGDDGADAEQLRHLRDATGVSYLTVPGDLALRLAPLVARLAGT